MKAFDVKSDSSAESDEDSNFMKLKFKVDDRVRISKYKNIFAKVYTQNWSEEVFVVSKIKNTVLWIYVIRELNCEKIAFKVFVKKNCQKLVKKNSE